MRALFPWIRSEWRSSWRSLVVLASVIAFGGAVTIAAAAGARRADSAFDRLLAIEGAPIQLTADPLVDDPRLAQMWTGLPEQLAEIDGVQGVRPVAWAGVALEVGGAPLNFFSGIIGDPIGEGPPGSFIVRGERADRADEVVLNEAAAARVGADVGDVVRVRSLSIDQMETFVVGNRDQDRGPTLDVEVVGIARGPEDVAYASQAMAFFPSDFRTVHGDAIAMCDCAIIVNAASRDVERVVGAISELIDDSPIVVGQYDLESSATVRHAVSLEVGALWIAAAVAGLATLVAVVQTVARHTGSRRGTTQALVALGATRPTIARAVAVVVLPGVAVGIVAAAASAIALSSLFPRGLARRAEPAPGIRVDPTAIGLGALILVGAVIGVTWAITNRSTSASIAAQGPPTTTRFAWRPTPPAGLGTALAIDPAGDRSRLAVASAVFGMSLGVAGFLAVGLVDESTSHLLATPEAFAADWDHEISDSPDDPDAVIEATMAEPIEAFSFKYVVNGSEVEVTGPSDMALAQPFALVDAIGTTGPFVDRGRPLRGADDAMIGERLAAAIGADIGDDIRLDPGGVVYRVTGIGRISNQEHTDRSLVLTPDGLSRLTPDSEPSLTGAYLRAGDVDGAVRTRLAALGWQPSSPPSRIANLGQIGGVPQLLAASLAVLAIAGVAHALLVAVGRRPKDISVARALGFTPHQARAAIAWQGVVTTAAGAALGIPLGLLAGRVVWKWIAEGVGAVDVLSIPWRTLLVVPIGALVVVVAIGSLVGRRAAGLRPAETLRSE